MDCGLEGAETRAAGKPARAALSQILDRHNARSLTLCNPYSTMTRVLRFLTAGESHGPALTVVVEGLPAGVPVEKEKIDADLRRRQGGYGRGGRMKIEQDQVEVLSGVRHGRTLGSPVALRARTRAAGRLSPIATARSPATRSSTSSCVPRSSCQPNTARRFMRAA